MSAAKLGAAFPAIKDAGGRIAEKIEELVKEKGGLAIGVLGVLQPMQERVRGVAPFAVWWMEEVGWSRELG